MLNFRMAAIALLFSSLLGCGGGGGGAGDDDTSISLSTNAVTLSADVGSGTAPASTVTVNFRGAGVVVGTLPGQTLPTWLAGPTPDSTTATQVVFTVRAFPFSMARGTYTATLRFVTGRADQTNLKTADLTVNLRVNTPFSATTTAPLSFLGVDGAASATAVGPSTIQIGGDDVQWRASANQPWVAFGAPSGAQAGDLAVSADRQTLGLGVHTAQITITDDRRNRTVTLPISFEVRPARIALSASALQYDVNGQALASEFERALTVSDELDGANPQKGVTWTASTDAPWLALSSAAGSSSPGQQMVVRLETSELNVLPSGAYTTNITFSYQDSAGGARSLELPVMLNVRLPLARAATPYLLTPGVASTIRLRGQDIRDVDLSSFTIDGATPSSVARDDDTRLTLQFSALAAGLYPIRFNTSSGLTRSAARIVVGTASPGEGVIESANVKRLVLDEQRGRLIAVDRTQFEIEAYQWNGANWALEATVSVPEVADAALSRNGEELIVIARHAIYALDADDLSQPARELWRRPPEPSYTPSLNTIQLNDLGVGLIAQTYHFAGISGSTPVLEFDSIVRGAPASIGFDLVYEGQLAHSPSGRYLLLGNYGVSPPMAPWLYDGDAIGESLLGARTTIQHGGSMSLQVNHAETRVLQYFKNVYDLTGQLLGMLPTESFGDDFAILSPNGERAYRLIRTTGGGSHLNIHDLTATPNPEYAVIGQIALPADIIDDDEFIGLYPGATLAVAGVMSRDGRYLFLAGPQRIVVVDVLN